MSIEPSPSNLLSTDNGNGKTVPGKRISLAMQEIQQTLLEQMRINDIEIARRKELLDINHEEVRLLKECKPIIEAELDPIINAFQQQQVTVPEVALLIGDSDTLDRLNQVQRTYIIDLFSGFYDEHYVNNRLRIGKVHKRIGLEPKLYMAAVRNLKEFLMIALGDHIHDPKQLLAVERALEKVIFFDITLVFDTYIRSLVGEIESAKDRAEMYARSLEAKVADRTQQLADLARRDPLTNLYNQRSLHEFLRRDLQQAKRSGGIISLAYFDIDDFKQINDSHGHQAGNEVLSAVAASMREVLRETDVPCRFGGDEFCIILPCNIEEAREVCSRMYRRFAKNYPDISLSVGLAQAGPRDYPDPESLINLSDQKMYESKAQEGFYISS